MRKLIFLLPIFAACILSAQTGPTLPIPVRAANSWNVTPSQINDIETQADAQGWTANPQPAPCAGCAQGIVTFKSVVALVYSYQAGVLTITIQDLPWYIGRPMMWNEVQSWMPTNVYANSNVPIELP